MENYTKNPIDDVNKGVSAESSITKLVTSLLVLVVVGGVFAYFGSKIITEKVQDSGYANDSSVYDSSFASLEAVGINTDLQGVEGIVSTVPGTESHDFRKTANVSFYEQKAAQALDQGLLQEWADAQIEVSAAYIAQGGGDMATEASDALKSVVSNKELSRSIRARALRSLAGLYCRSGLDKDVFDAIYTGPYAEFYKEGDPMLAGRRVMEASHKLFPRARTAVSIAHMHIDPIVNGDLSDKEKADARDEGLTFLRNAEVLAQDSFNSREVSGQYASYLFWRAVSYGQLAMEFSEYVDEAENAYSNLFGYIDGYTGTFTTTVTDIIPFAHLRYVNFLTEIYGDEEAEKIERNLDVLVALVEEDSAPEVNIFVKYLNNKLEDLEETGEYTHWLSDSRKYSDKYDSFLRVYGL